MSPIDMLFEFVRQNLLPTIFIVFIGISILRRALQQASQDQARRRERASLPRPGSDDDLREQVRRGFEEMMRQRTAAARSAPKAAVKPAPKPPPRVAVRPTPAPGKAPAFDVALAQVAAARMAALMREKQAPRRSIAQTPSLARRLLADRSATRRALLLREVLDEPRALRAWR
jgi:hypothetical protein